MRVHIACLLLLHSVITALYTLLRLYKTDQPVSVDLLSVGMRSACLFLIYYLVVFNHTLPALSAGIKKVFTFLGNSSYPLYIVHLTIILFCLEHRVHDWKLVTVICLAAACVVYLLVDVYSRKRWRPVRS